MTALLSNATVVVPLALLAWIVSRTRIRPAVTHALWVLVFVKLLTPPLVEVPLHWSIGQPDAEIAVRTEPANSVEQSTNRIQVQVEPTVPPQLAAVDASSAQSQWQQGSRQTVRHSEVRQHVRDWAAASVAWVDRRVAPLRHLNWDAIRQWVVPAWIFGSVAIAAMFAWRLLTIVRLLRAFGRTEPAASRYVEQLAAELGLKSAPRLVLLDAIASPMLFGLGSRVQLVFPIDLWNGLPDRQRRLLLMHELVHYQRGDYWTRLLELVATVLYWWHPVLWWARYGVEAAEEDCCDAAVVQRARAPRQYAEAIIQTLEFLSEPARPLPPLASGLSRVPALKKRLTRIMTARTQPRLGRVGTLLLLVVFGMTVPLHPLLAFVPATSARLTVNELAPVRSDEAVPEQKRQPAEVGDTQEIITNPDLQIPEPVGWWSPPQTTRWAVAMAPNGRSRLIAHTGHNVRLELTDSEVSFALNGEGITSAAYLPAGDRFVTGSTDGWVRLWEVESGKAVSSLGQHTSLSDQRPVAVNSITVSPDGRVVTSGAADGSVIQWDTSSGAMRATWTERELPITSVRYSDDGRTLAIVAGDWRNTGESEVRLLTADELQPIASVHIPRNLALAVPAFGSKVSLAEWNGSLLEWDWQSNEVRQSAQLSATDVNDASFAPRPLL